MFIFHWLYEWVGRRGYLVWDLRVPFVPIPMGQFCAHEATKHNIIDSIVGEQALHFLCVFFFCILRKPKQHSRENRPTTTHSVSYRTTACSKARAYHKTHSTSCQVRPLFSFILSFCSFSSHHGLMLCSNLAATKWLCGTN